MTNLEIILSGVIVVLIIGYIIPIFLERLNDK